MKVSLSRPPGIDCDSRRCHYACWPTEGPDVLARLRHVSGDANAVFRTAAVRAAGGYETDRDPSNDDREVFVKLAGAGYGLGVLPEHLFCYRHLDSCFARVTSPHRKYRRALPSQREPLLRHQAFLLVPWEMGAACP
jgi:hypothetical protein